MVHPPRKPHLGWEVRVTLFTFPLLAGTACWFFFSSSSHIHPHALVCLLQRQGGTTCEEGDPTCTRGTRTAVRRDYIYRMFTRGHKQVCLYLCLCMCMHRRIEHLSSTGVDQTATSLPKTKCNGLCALSDPRIQYGTTPTPPPTTRV